MKEERIIQQLDKMVASGQVTRQEAERLRSTQGTPEFEAAIAAVRVRHASVRLDSAVNDGSMSREEADGHLEQLRQGAHPKGLRAQLRRHRQPSHE